MNHHQGAPLLVDAYAEMRGTYSDFASRLQILLQQLTVGIHTHSITSRAKDVLSLNRKISIRSGAQPYGALSEVTDLCGLRVTTYFAKDVQAACQKGEEEFEIDVENSRRISVDPDRFGYTSVHYIARLKPSRAQLPEWKPFAALKFEIQLRSILQHAWAEIEHDLGYKSEVAVPQQVRRRFARLAGLLELADIEFDGIRSEIEAYRSTVSTTAQEPTDDVLLDKDSLLAFIVASADVRRIDLGIAAIGKTTINEASTQPADSLIRSLHWLGIVNLKELETALSSHEEGILRLARGWMGQAGILSRGISIFYLAYVLVGRSQDLTRIVSYFEMASLGLATQRTESARKLAGLTKP